VEDQDAKHKYDIIIIGAGALGMTVGIECAKHGLNYLILEKGMLVNTIFHFPTNMTFFSTSKLLEIGDVPFISHGEKPTRTESLEYFRRVQEKWKLNIHYYERVMDITGSDGAFVVKTTKGEYHTRKVVVATGFYDYPVLMGVPGEQLPKVKHYYDEPHPYIHQKVAVIGGANSACDVALELFHKGADVTIVVRESQLSDRVKYWIKPNIENRIKEGSIKAYFQATVKEILESEIVIDTPDGIVRLTNDFVLAMTGYQPDFPFLQKLGIQWEPDEEQELKYNQLTHETTVPGIYVAGVVCGGMHTNKFFIENAKDHAEKIVDDVVRKLSLSAPQTGAKDPNMR
jgi:thioredoxin reductase (NADPH)